MFYFQIIFKAPDTFRVNIFLKATNLKIRLPCDIHTHTHTHYYENEVYWIALLLAPSAKLLVISATALIFGYLGCQTICTYLTVGGNWWV